MELVTVAHGAGGEDTWRIVERLIRSRVPPELRKLGSGVGLDELDDGASIEGAERLVVTIDSYTVSPLRFPGGSIGSLAAHGTINDLVVMGARPAAFMDSIVVEEGMDMEEVEDLVNDFVEVLKRYRIALIGGDFKVMPRGSLSGMIITVVGLGVAKRIIVDRVREGDRIVVTGPIAEHGATILAAQMGMLDRAPELRSDTKPLIDTVLPVIEEFAQHIHAARDATRGGLAAVLNEWVRGTELAIVVDRSSIPIRREVESFLDMLGIDPLTVACEGVAVLAVDPSVAEDVVEELRRRGEARARIVGEVVKPRTPVARGRVLARTEAGGLAFVEARALNLPRIC